MLEAAWIALAVVFVGITFALVQSHRSEGASAYWGAAMGAAFGAGVCNLVLFERPNYLLIENALAMAYPAILLSGALRFAGRRVPGWLVPVAAVIGAIRGSAALAGFTSTAVAMGLTLPPAGAAAAAWLVYGASRTGAPLPERLFAPVLAATAVLQFVTVLTVPTGGQISWQMILPWAATVPMILAFGYAAESARSSDIIRRAREELEQRVEERTGELRESEERYRIVSELSSDFAMAYRVGGGNPLHFEWVTAAVTRVTGFEQSEFVGNHWFKIIHPDDRAHVLEAADSVLQGEPRSFECRVIAKSGETRWLFVVLGARRRNSDGSTLVVGSARNVTDRKRAELERRQLDQHMQEVQRLESLGVLAGGIAHDFNNLLTVIRGNTHLAIDDLPEVSPARDRLSRIQAAAEYAQGLTRQMLTYSGKASLTLRPVDVSRITVEMLDLLRASVSKNGQLDVDLAEHLPAIEGDETQIRQVVLNLVINASEALTEDGGSIHVRTRLIVIGGRRLRGAFGSPDPTPGDYVAIEVSDTGEGIDDATVTRVFEPFFTSKSSGRGLGLAAVLGIVRAHRGVIEVESERGAGTTFRVLIPSTVQSAERPVSRDARTEPLRGSGRILVVDDEEAVLEVAQQFLERAGFEVVAAHGGRAAVDALRASKVKIDAVVLDLVMPELSGEETFDALRQIRADLPIVLVSGYDKEMASERFFGRGIAGFLYKPYEPDELVERVRAAVEG